MSDLSRTEGKTYEVLNNLHEQAPDLSIVYLKGQFSTLDIIFVDQGSGKTIRIPGMLVAGDIYTHAKKYERWAAEQVFFSYPSTNTGLTNFDAYLSRYLDAYERMPIKDLQELKNLRYKLWQEYENDCQLRGVFPAKDRAHVRKSYKDLFQKTLVNKQEEWVKRKATAEIGRE